MAAIVADTSTVLKWYIPESTTNRLWQFVTMFSTAHTTCAHRRSCPSNTFPGRTDILPRVQSWGSTVTDRAHDGRFPTRVVRWGCGPCQSGPRLG
jgi:hypothetical protein